jgi:hypothetical protein
VPRFYFPALSNGTPRPDPVGSDHDHAQAAIREGQAYAREMAMERIRQGECDFEEIVEIRDEAGRLLGRQAIKVSGSGQTF